MGPFSTLQRRIFLPRKYPGNSQAKVVQLGRQKPEGGLKFRFIRFYFGLSGFCLAICLAKSKTLPS